MAAKWSDDGKFPLAVGGDLGASSTTLVGLTGYPGAPLNKKITLAVLGAFLFASPVLTGNVSSPAGTEWSLANSAAVSGWFATQATARIGGGSGNGLAVRNSINTRDNWLFNDAGDTATINNGTLTGMLQLQGASGERSNAFALTGSTTADAVLFAGVTAARKVQMLYFDGTAIRSAAEVTNPTPTAFGTLLLMKSGGQVTINDGSAGTASALYVKGSAYGAATASIRLDGLTTGAAAGVGTLTNAPASTNPNFWCPINIAGTVRFFPCW